MAQVVPWLLWHALFVRRCPRHRWHDHRAACVRDLTALARQHDATHVQLRLSFQGAVSAGQALLAVAAM